MIDYPELEVTLHALSADNLELYRGNRNDRCIRRWCRQRNLIDATQQEQWFHAQSADPTVEMFEMRNRAQVPVGVCGLTDIDHVNRRAEFSLYVFVKHHGEGYGLHGLRALVRFGFDDLNLNMIWGETVGLNPARTTFAKVGFMQTGLRPSFYYKEGEYHDSYIYCLERSRWHS